MQHRIDWIDALKGFAILSVVIGHCIADSISSQTFPQYAALLQMMYDAIYSFHMPLFFMISGYVFYLTKSYRKWKTKVLDFSIVYVIWSALMWFSKYMMNGDVNQSRHNHRLGQYCLQTNYDLLVSLCSDHSVRDRILLKMGER